jgi:molybdopterin-dependent oxidoreductase alpha subunit
MKSVGGFTSIRYALGVGKETGFKNLYLALTSKNTCKTCALGMGGQSGGMRNEAGEFPEVCKKSFQAQLTDIQPEIPLSLFREKSIESLKTLRPVEIERLGRLNYPLFKKKGGTHYEPISWEEALGKIILRLRETNADRSFFYSSGRSSNEAAFLLQLFVRLYGTNNINNCSFYCHQASGVGMSSTLGASTATVDLEDLKHADLIFVIGANPASNHPRFVKELMRCNWSGGHVVVVNPLIEPGMVRFSIPSSARSMISRGTNIAGTYLQPHIGGDIALLKGIAKAVLEKGGADESYAARYTNGFESYTNDLIHTSWKEIVETSGIEKDKIEAVADHYVRSEKVIFAWAMGITHHDHGVENVESIVNLALLRGMAGRKHAGLLPLRGHSNVQGIGSVGVTPVLKEKIMNNLEQLLGVKLPSAPGMDTMACMDAAYEHKIDTAFLMGGNLYASNPDSTFSEEALNRIPFKVFLNTTLNQGHLFGVDEEVVILPVAARDEEKQSTTQESMFSFIRLSDGGIVRLNNVRSENDIICDIAIGVLEEKQVKFSAYKQHNNVRQAIAAAIPGFEKIEDIGTTKKEFQISGRILHEPEFPTADKKANFKTIPIPALKGEKEEFRLMSIRSEGQFNSIVYEEYDLFRAQKERWIVLMNPTDIQKLGIREDDFVTLENATGRMEKLKVKAYDIRAGNLATYYPEANILIPKTTDSRSKTPSFKAVAVKVICFQDAKVHR